MNFIKNSKGITLIALVITIIVLLILAGVSFNLVMGNQGILQQATKAVAKNDEAKIKEEVELAMAELQTQYYKEKYVDKSTDQEYGAYVEEKLTTGIPTSSGATVKLESGKVNYKDAKGNKLAEGTYDASTGSVTIAGTTTGGSNAGGGSTEKTLASQITAENYGEYVDLGTSYVKGNALETGTATEDWRIFYKDSTGGVYLILADYLPYSYETSATVGSATGLGTGLKNGGTDYSYNWRSLTSRADLLTRLKDTSSWNKLLNATYIAKGITVKGAVVMETYKDSWNAKGYKTMCLATTGMDDGLDGYYVGASESNLTSTYYDFSSDTNGYGNTLYYPHKSKVSNNYGYWLASPSADYAGYVMFVSCGGNVGNDTHSNDLNLGVRPAVYLPSGILAEKNANGVWEIK